MTVDDGGAPNFDPPMATLAICKPHIRRGAQSGDLVLGFTGRALGDNPHAVLWAGVVKEKLSFEDYWEDRRFQRKKPGHRSMPDNIYRPRGEWFEQVPNEKHNKPRQMAADLAGEWVLAFERYWYFGDRRPELPARFGLRLTTSRRGHRWNDLDPSESAALVRWLDGKAGTRGGGTRSRKVSAGRRKRSC